MTADVAVIGVGSFGRLHVQAMLAAGARVIAVVDCDAGRARTVATEYRIEHWFCDIDALFARCRPQAVTIAAASPDHVSLALSAINYGCRVLLEKPIAMDRAGAHKLTKLGRGRIQPGHLLRFVPAIRELREQVRAGAIGRVIGIAASRNRDQSHVARYRGTHPALLTTVHDIDLALWFTATNGREVTARATPSDCSAALVFATVCGADESTWSIRTSWLLPDGEPPSDRFEIYGTAGIAAIDVADGHLTTSLGSPRAVTFTGEFDDLTALTAECATLLSGRDTSVITMEEAAHGIAIAEAIVESATRDGATVRVQG